MTLRVPLTDSEQDHAYCCLVTGGGGFVGSALVKRLLAAGHTVHATARNTKKLEPLMELEGAKERLKLFSADLLEIGSFEEAIKGCSHVFHVASPFITNVPPKDVQDKLLKPAVTGVENVLETCCKTPSVTNVVVTSSVVAILGALDEHGDRPATEEDWNNTSSEKFLPYNYSKTLAERKAWEIYERQKETSQHPWTMSTINPSFVMGPPVIVSGGESITFMKNAIDGKYKSGLPALGMGVVDVDDVAKAHVVAGMNPKVQPGRYICSSESGLMPDLLRKVGSTLQPPRKLVGPTLPTWVAWIACNIFRQGPWSTIGPQLNKIPQFDNTKARTQLGIDFISPVKSMCDMIEELERQNS